jgi:hypothetical protein
MVGLNDGATDGTEDTSSDFELLLLLLDDFLESLLLELLLLFDSDSFFFGLGPQGFLDFFFFSLPMLLLEELLLTTSSFFCSLSLLLLEAFLLALLFVVTSSLELTLSLGKGCSLDLDADCFFFSSLSLSSFDEEDEEAFDNSDLLDFGELPLSREKRRSSCVVSSIRVGILNWTSCCCEVIIAGATIINTIKIADVCFCWNMMNVFVCLLTDIRIMSSCSD